MFPLFESSPAVAEHEDQSCRCGDGYCPAHGTYHYGDEMEIVEATIRERRPEGGVRVVRKKIGDE